MDNPKPTNGAPTAETEVQPQLTAAPDNKELLREIIRETQIAQQSHALIDVEAAAAIMQERIDAMGTIRLGAIRATQPHQWTLYRDKSGLISARFKHAAAMTIGSIFGITVTPLDEVTIVPAKEGNRAYAEIHGRATSVVTGVSVPRFRAYRVEGEDFSGRPAEDTTYGSGAKVVGVGDNDWLQSTETCLQTKGVRLCSGLINCSITELRAAWEGAPHNFKSDEDVIAACTQGHGFGSGGGAERKSTDTRPINEKQQGLLRYKASNRLTELKKTIPDMPKITPNDIVKECLLKVAPISQGKLAECPRSSMDAAIAAIESWGPGSGEPEKTDDHPDAELFQEEGRP